MCGLVDTVGCKSTGDDGCTWDEPGLEEVGTGNRGLGRADRWDGVRSTVVDSRADVDADRDDESGRCSSVEEGCSAPNPGGSGPDESSALSS